MVNEFRNRVLADFKSLANKYNLEFINGTEYPKNLSGLSYIYKQKKDNQIEGCRAILSIHTSGKRRYTNVCWEGFTLEIYNYLTEHASKSFVVVIEELRQDVIVIPFRIVDRNAGPHSTGISFKLRIDKNGVYSLDDGSVPGSYKLIEDLLKKSKESDQS